MKKVFSFIMALAIMMSAITPLIAPAPAAACIEDESGLIWYYDAETGLFYTFIGRPMIKGVPNVEVFRSAPAPD